MICGLPWLGVDSWVLPCCLCACWVIGFLHDWSLWVCGCCLWGLIAGLLVGLVSWV